MRYVLFAGLLIVVGVFVVSGRNVDEIGVEVGDLSSQINSEGQVSVEVTPTDVSEGSEVWRFEIILDTHSVELSQDLVEVVMLNGLKPASWDGPEAGGHHIAGVLTFEPVSPRPEEILMGVREVGGINERTFLWEL